jgi:signal transduction histidine kinase/CHASE3 domain sensor protein
MWMRVRPRGGSQAGDPDAGTTRRSGGLTRRMVLASVALALVIGAAFTLLLLAVGDVRSAERSALKSQDVLIAANTLERRLLDLETGQRGFVITRQEQFLEPWQQAQAQFPPESQALIALTSGHSHSQERALGIVQAMRSYIDDYSLPLVNAARRGDPSASSVPTTEEGKVRVDAIRQEFDRLLTDERRVSVAAAEDSSDAATRAYVGAAVGIGGSVALIAAYAGYVSRAIVRPTRRAAAMAGQLAGGDLTARLPETGVGEIGTLERAFNVMGTSLERSRDELAALAAEQAALRRVATLVAHAAAPDVVFAAVAAEIGQLLPLADYTIIGRYDRQGSQFTNMGSWTRAGNSADFPPTFAVDEQSVSAVVWTSQRSARISSYAHASGATAALTRELGIRSSVAAPINVEGRLWGVVVVSSTRETPLPADTESRLASFTELVATAIANAEAHAELTASRARVVVTADETRRRIERDLHDGAQQRLVSLALHLRAAQATVPPDQRQLAGELGRVATGLASALDELREFARGIHPAILAEGGLPPALRTLARRAALPVQLTVHTNGRLPERIEVATYYVISEALANATKHAHASTITIDVHTRDDMLDVTVHDDGVGGADFTRGSGLVGLKDRVDALGGHLTLHSPPGTGTTLTIQLPLSENAR